jgi:hypothetical protein
LSPASPKTLFFALRQVAGVDNEDHAGWIEDIGHLKISARIGLTPGEIGSASASLWVAPRGVVHNLFCLI